MDFMRWKESLLSCCKRNKYQHAPNRGIPEGWQSPFATETGGLSQTGNSVASAEQTSAAHETNHPQTKNRVIPGSDPGSSLLRNIRERL